MTFEERVKAAGLKPKADDMPKLEALVNDLDKAAALVNGGRSYAEEPITALALKRAG